MFIYINYSNRDCLFDPGLDKEQNRNEKTDKTQNDADEYCIDCCSIKTTAKKWRKKNNILLMHNAHGRTNIDNRQIINIFEF